MAAVALRLAIDGGRPDDWITPLAAEFASRAASIEQLARASWSWERGEVEIDVVLDAARYDTPLALDRLATDFPLVEIERPVPELPCLDTWQFCVLEFIDLRRSLQPARPFPPVASVLPSDFCVGDTLPFLIRPPAGEAFPDRDPNGATPFLVTVGGTLAHIDYWSTSAVWVTVPAALAGGCHPVEWLQLLDPEAAVRARGIAGACMPFFGPIAIPPSFLTHEIGRISIIGEPSAMLMADGRVSHLRAEACTAVTLTWSVDLERCPGSAASLEVSFFEDGNLIGTNLADQGEVVVSGAGTTTYMLRAEARLGTQVCGRAEQTVVVERFHALRAGLDPPTQCFDRGTGLSLWVRSSCPAPVGSLLVNVVSSDLLRIASTQMIIPEGISEETTTLLAGEECGHVTIAITAAGHQGAQLSLEVVDLPNIHTINPTSFVTCEPVNVAIDGTCLGSDPSRIQVRATAVDGTRIRGRIAVVAPNTRLQVEFPTLKPGDYLIEVENCGRSGIGTAYLVVTEDAPTIEEFTVTPSAIHRCTTQNVRVCFRSRGATRAVVRQGTRQVAPDLTQADACAGWTDMVPDPIPVGPGAVYSLEVSSPGGLTAFRTSPHIFPVSNYWDTSGFLVTNSRGYAYDVWLLGSVAGGVLAATVLTGATAQINLPACALAFVSVVDPEALAQHNARFPNDQYGRMDERTARTMGLWAYSPWPNVLFLGQPTAQPASFTI